MLSKESDQYKKCLELLPLVLDSQASSQDTEFFHQHIVNWPDVIDCYQNERAFREALRDKLGRHVAPEELLSAIRQHVRLQKVS